MELSITVCFMLAGKEFLGQNIKVEFAEKRVPKGGFGRGGGRGTVIQQNPDINIPSIANDICLIFQPCFSTQEVEEVAVVVVVMVVATEGVVEMIAAVVAAAVEQEEETRAS